jgi:DNA-binding GntR family transcriptional regulator
MSSPSDQLRSWLDETLETAKPGEWLPSDRRLANHWGLSMRTVQRIMASYANRGQVVRVRGRGTRAPGEIASAETATFLRRESSAESLMARLRDMMRTGELKRGQTLPQVKWLCREFHLSPRTVSLAYHRLQDDGVVVRVGRNFRVGSFRSLAREAGRREVYLFAKNAQEFREAFKEDILAHSYLRMHNELSHHGFILLFETFDKLQEHFQRWNRRHRYPFGIVLFRWRNNVDELQKQLDTMRQRAKHASCQPPAMLVDLLKVVDKPPRGIIVVYRSTLSTAVARALAEFVRRKAYSNVVFFLDETQRYDVEHGYSWASIWPVLKVKSELNDALANATFGLAAKPLKGPHTVTSFLKRQISHHGESLAQTLLDALGLKSFDELEGRLEVAKDFASLFSEVCKPGSVWVFSTDYEADRALQWARNNGIGVPEQLAIIGLENNSDYFPKGITTVEPDWETIGYLMAHAIIGDFGLERTSRGYMRIAASVHERLTT